MAGISGSELDAIHKQIKDFPNSHSQLESSLHLDKGLTNILHRNKRHVSAGELKRTNMSGDIQQLEAEILNLEQAIKKQEEKNRKLQLWQKSQMGKQLMDTNTDMVKAHLESLKYQIDRLGEITGVNIVETKTEILERGETSCRKRKQTEGYCGQVDFKLDMEIEEVMNLDTALTDARINELSITASENITEDLEGTLETLAIERNAHGFLRLLPPYNQWLAAREKTFQHFTTKYPKIVNRTSKEELSLNHPTKKVTIVIEWTFTVTDTCLVVPDLQINIQVPKKASKSSSVLATASEMFQLMLKELGIETAIHNLIKLLQET